MSSNRRKVEAAVKELRLMENKMFAMQHQAGEFARACQFLAVGLESLLPKEEPDASEPAGQGALATEAAPEAERAGAS